MDYLRYQLLRIEVFFATFIDLSVDGLKIGSFRIIPRSKVNKMGGFTIEQCKKFYIFNLFVFWLTFPKHQ